MILESFGIDIVAFDNSVDPFIPEMWANESLLILENNMVMANMVHRDFDNVVANYGDTVNTRKPGEFTAVRKTNADSVTIQDATATNVPVVLNQWVHVSFIIKDGERTMSFKDLVEIYLQPGMLAQAQFLDQVLCGQTGRFLANTVGEFGGLTSTTAKDQILDVRQKLNDNKAWTSGRNFVWTSAGETAILKNDAFTSADKVGDGGEAFREAEIGRKLGFRHFMDQNQPYAHTGINTSAVGAVNNVGGYAAGTTTLVTDGAGLSAANIAIGDWISVAGDASPQQVTSLTGGPPYTGIVITPGLRSAVLDDAVITVLKRGAINLVAGYAAGYAKPLTVNGFTVAPQAGQFVTFAAQTHVYMVMSATTTSITLDRPLEAALSNSDTVHLLPEGQYNFAFHRNALTLVVRPIELPMQGVGARAGRATYNNMSMRAVITYDGNKQGHLVTLDMLYGVQVLDVNLGAVLLG